MSRRRVRTEDAANLCLSGNLKSLAAPFILPRASGLLPRASTTLDGAATSPDGGHTRGWAEARLTEQHREGLPRFLAAAGPECGGGARALVGYAGAQDF